MNDIKLSDHRPVFADLILYKNTTASEISVIIIDLFTLFFFVYTLDYKGNSFDKNR